MMDGAGEIPETRLELKEGFTMRIRILDSRDAEAFWQVRLRSLREHPDAFGADYDEVKDRPAEQVASKLVPAPDAKVFGAFAETGELIGIAGLVRDGNGRKMRHRAKLWGMYVIPEARGQGVGKKLMEAVLEEADAMLGVEQVLLTVTSHNDAAKRLYVSTGFKVWGREPRALRLPDGRYVDEEHMIRFLTDQGNPG
jgi:ribosomal protein S18 acetylase RimI-like enzyme